MELKSCKSCWTQKLIMRQFNFEQRITMIRRAALGKLAVTPEATLAPPLTGDWPHPRFWCCHNSDKSLYQDIINTSLISTIFPPVHATCTTLYSNTLEGSLHPYFVRKSYKVNQSVVSFILKWTFLEGHFFQTNVFRRALFKRTDLEV